MLTTLVFGSAFIFALGMLARLGLVVTGKLKDPLLAQFEHYGGDELRFNLLPSVFLWLGIALFTGHTVLNPFLLLPASMAFTGFLLFVVGGSIFLMAPELRERLGNLSPRPPWYRKLMDYTSRSERRQLAYMWLRLPRRTRLRFNVNDRAFYQWADLIIMSATSY